MSMMKNLTALTLSAALVPAMALSTTAFADEMWDGDDDQRAGEEQRDEQRGVGDEQRAGEAEHAGEQREKGEQYISSKPAGAMYGDDVIGKTIKHRDSDEDVGEITDLVIGEDGRVAGVVVQTGGFLGLGGQDVGLGWDHIEQSMEDDESVFYVDMDEDELRNAPEHQRDEE